MTAILSLKNITHRYNHIPVLQVPALEIAAESITGLVGANGSGKSTMLMLMAFIEKPTAGEIYYKGMPAVPFSPQVRSRLSLLTQEPYLLKRSIFENVAFGIKNHGKGLQVEREVYKALDLVGLPKSFAKRYWNEVSGGEAQRVALAARLALRPEVLLLDEPTASVDLQSAEKIRQAVLMARNDWKTTLIIASHNRAWLDAICDSTVFMYNGRIFAGELENVVFGPWTRFGDGTIGKILADGQRLVLGDSQERCGDCMISPDNINLFPAEGGIPAGMVAGKIVSISARKQDNGLSVRVHCGDNVFVVHVSRQKFAANFWQPGQAVLLGVKPADVVWLAEE